MKREEVLKEFQDAGAILSGHFILSSGLHSPTYLQCARVLMDAQRADRLCNALAQKVTEKMEGIKFDMIFSPAMGGVVVGYEMGRQLNIPSVFCERVDGKFVLRRGFGLEKGMKLLLVEDVVTTGKSSLEAVECAREYGAEVVAEASLINRSGQENPLPFPLISLMALEVPTYASDKLPPELAAIPAVKPGSRFLQAG